MFRNSSGGGVVVRGVLKLQKMETRNIHFLESLYMRVNLPSNFQPFLQSTVVIRENHQPLMLLRFCHANYFRRHDVALMLSDAALHDSFGLKSKIRDPTSMTTLKPHHGGREAKTTYLPRGMEGYGGTVSHQPNLTWSSRRVGP